MTTAFPGQMGHAIPNLQASPPVETVYGHIRSFHGIENSITKDLLVSEIVINDKAFGPVINSYLTSRGYTADAVAFISAAYRNSTSLEDFVGMVVSCGMVVSEAEWIWFWATTT